LTVAVATREPALGRDAAALGASSRLFEPQGATLEDAILRIWDELLADGRADCPVCGEMVAGAGGCEGCGSELS
jgi:hypothetical protein